MKGRNKSPFFSPVLMAILGLLTAGRVRAQTFTVLHTFTSESNGPTRPYAGVILSGTNLYGVTDRGGSWGLGAVFRVSTDGTHFTNLHSLTDASGIYPRGRLVLSGDTLYGTTSQGFPNGGTVFAINTDGSDFRILYTFSEKEFINTSGLIISGNILYGTRSGGGSFGSGVVFAINTDGTGFTNLYNFTAGPLNTDGAHPIAELILSDSTLDGTTSEGGMSGGGTIFRLDTNGLSFTNLHNFTDGFNGVFPHAGLVVVSNTLYGVTTSGWASGDGVIFKLKTDGTSFTNLYHFSGGNDGGFPNFTLIVFGNTLCGTTVGGGNSNSGTVFKVNTDGSDFATLHHFTATSGPNFSGTNSDGTLLYSGLFLRDNTLYGTALRGGTLGNGTVFSIFIQPQLTIIPFQTDIVLTWPTNYSDFTLQSTTNLISPVWITNSQLPVVVNGQYTVTNPISGNQQFFRLSK